MYAQPIPGPSRVTYDDQPMCVSPGARLSIGSFNAAAQLFPGCSPGNLFGPHDVFDYQMHCRSTSFDQPQASPFAQMLSTSVGKTNPLAGEMARDYTCCGLRLSDLHALVEHFEERHVVVVDDPSFDFNTFAPHPTMADMTGFPQPPVAQATLPNFEHHVQQPQLQSLEPQPQLYSFNAGPTGPATTFQQLAQQPLPQDLDLDIEPMEDMEFDDGSSSSSSRANSVSSASTPGPSPPLTPILPFDTTAVRMAGVGAGIGSGVVSPGSSVGLRLETAFNRYANYTEFSAMLPGTLNSTLNSPAAISAADWMTHSRRKSKVRGCVTPAQLVSPTASSPPSPSSSAPASPHPQRASSHPIPHHLPTRSQTLPNIYPTSSQHTAGSSTNPLSKPFTCPRPNCTKSYKQANGLKYHLLHGSCSYTPPDPSLNALSPLEVEKRLKPYKCQVEGSGCERRYKNMNGLRYHYAHSGLHGEIGMRILMGQQAMEQKEKAAAASAARSVAGSVSGSSSAATSRHTSPFQPPQQILPYPLQPQQPSHLREQMA